MKQNNKSMKATRLLSTATLVSSALASSLLISSHSYAAQKIDKRWFEVEVILFSQLGDKNKLQENFDGKANLPRYRQVIDLLTPYLQPDTQSLRVQLPSCVDRTYAPSWLTTQTKLPSLHNEKSLDDIERLPTEQLLTEQVITDQALNTDVISNPNAELNAYDSFSELTNSTNEQALNEVEFAEQLSDEQIVNKLENNEFNNSLTEILIPLSEEELALVAQAEHELGNKVEKLAYEDVSQTGITLCQPIAIDSNSTIADYYALNDYQTPSEFPIDELSGRIDGNEFVYTDKPYLIDADSLKLKDIPLQLRRSKNFRPLLHIGWRQPLTNRKKPSREPAIRLFAGSHYQQQYQNALADYQSKLTLQNLNELQQVQLADATTVFDSQGEVNSKETAFENTTPEQLQSQQHLASIYQTLESASYNLNDTLATLDKVELTPLAPNELNSSDNTPLIKTLTEPQAPNQDWLVDGLFRLHLNHYLYITADFSVAIPYSSEEAAEKNSHAFEFKHIPFSQNKRVISKEVHYFDHPYLGMVVQIRRYKKPEPPAPQSSE